MEFDPTLRDLTAPYIRSVLAELERAHHHFYTLLLHSTQVLFSINLIYDYRAEPVREDTVGDPVRTYSAREFLDQVHSFHKNDCFTIGMERGSVVIGTEAGFVPEAVVCLFTEQLRVRCRLNLFFNKALFIGNPHGAFAKDVSALNELVDSLNEEIVRDLQIQYDVLKKLDFIKK